VKYEYLGVDPAGQVAAALTGIDVPAAAELGAETASCVQAATVATEATTVTSTAACTCGTV
jgi:hypothetical protein